MKALIIAVIVSCLASIAAAQNKSVYTSTKANACRTIKATSAGAGSYEGECRGVGGYKLRLIEGDIRQTLDVITPGKKRFELNFWRFFGSFSLIGEKVEWRTKSGVPVALIARYIVSDPEDSRKSTSYLMVSRVGRNLSCVTDVVDPGPGQNKMARRLADTASARPCRSTD